MRKNQNTSVLKFFGFGLLALLIFLTFFPFVFMLITSFKSIFQFYHSFWAPTFPAHFENYAAVFLIIFRYIVNSVVVTMTSVVGIVFLGALFGFVFARFSFRGKKYYFMALSD